MSMQIAFRCDASARIGSGHVMRCLTLANALREKGAEIMFISREHPGHLFKKIESSGHRLMPLPMGSSAMLDGDLAHAHWLGVTWEEDVLHTSEMVNVFGDVDWLIVDHYALDSRWEFALRSCVSRIMAIDDLADRRHQCDLLLDQNWFADQTGYRYDNLVPENCIKLLGPDFALLRPEYGQLRHLMPTRDGSVRRVLIFMGGSDPSNETAKALTALLGDDFESLEVDVVVGFNHPDVASIKRLADRRPETNVYQNVPTLAELMVQADLMISGGGATTWERMCLGLPSIVICMAENQAATNESLMRAGYVNYLGYADEVDVRLIEGEVLRMMQQPEMLVTQSTLCQGLVSGKGANIVSEKIWSGVVCE